MKQRPYDACGARIPVSSRTPARRSGYGHRSTLGSAAIRCAAIIAASIMMVGLYNRPNGNWSGAVDIAPTQTTDHAQSHVR